MEEQGVGMELDLFAVGDAMDELDGWVVAPVNARLPMAEVGVLGRLQRVGRIDAGRTLPPERWPGIARDIDARGYGVLAADELPHGLGASREPANEPASAAGGTPIAA